nr:UBN2 domain-containing protein [Tanacetum cinerariifolium]
MNNEAKMTLYNALLRKEYERVFMSKTAKEIWHTLIITNQGNSKFKDCKIDILTQQYKKVSILKRAKVIAIEEAKDLVILPLDEIIGKLKVYEMILENNGVASKTTKEKVKSLALKAKVTREQTSEDSDTQRGSDKDEKAAVIVSGTKAVKAQDKGEDATIMAKKVTSLDDTTYLIQVDSQEAYDDGHVVFGSKLKGKVIGGGNISHDSITITNVEHVSGLAFNLINVGQLCDDG